MQRTDIFIALKEHVQLLSDHKKKPICIGINGIEGAGKTRFAADFVEYLQEQSIHAIHVTIEGFHHVQSWRYRQGRDSARGYYQDAYNDESFIRKVLMTSQESPPHYTPAIHDLASDELLSIPPRALQPDSVLITDGAYLFKPHYIPHWDLKVFLKIPFELAEQRGIDRDSNRLGGVDDAKKKYQSRYHAASRLYINECNPENVADVVIDNSDYENPVLIANRVVPPARASL